MVSSCPAVAVRKVSIKLSHLFLEQREYVRVASLPVGPLCRHRPLATRHSPLPCRKETSIHPCPPCRLSSCSFNVVPQAGLQQTSRKLPSHATPFPAVAAIYAIDAGCASLCVQHCCVVAPAASGLTLIRCCVAATWRPPHASSFVLRCSIGGERLPNYPCVLRCSSTANGATSGLFLRCTGNELRTVPLLVAMVLLHLRVFSTAAVALRSFAMQPCGCAALLVCSNGSAASHGDWQGCIALSYESRR